MLPKRLNHAEGGTRSESKIRSTTPISTEEMTVSSPCLRVFAVSSFFCANVFDIYYNESRRLVRVIYMSSTVAGEMPTRGPALSAAARARAAPSNTNPGAWAAATGATGIGDIKAVAATVGMGGDGCSRGRGGRGCRCSCSCSFSAT